MGSFNYDQIKIMTLLNLSLNLIFCCFDFPLFVRLLAGLKNTSPARK